MVLSHRDLCVKVGRWFIGQPWCQLMGWEITYNTGFADVVAISLKEKKRRVAVAEVKRTRSDLLQDLNKKKLLKYELGSSHCYLAATKEALRLNKISKEACLKELTELGLPKAWGVLVIDTEYETVESIRSAQQINEPTLPRLRLLTKRIARSHMYRMLNGPDTGESIPDSEEEC